MLSSDGLVPHLFFDLNFDNRFGRYDGGTFTAGQAPPTKLVSGVTAGNTSDLPTFVEPQGAGASTLIQEAFIVGSESLGGSATDDDKVLVLSDSTLLAGDFDADDDVDGADFLSWQRNPSGKNLADWESGYGTGSGSSPKSTVSFSIEGSDQPSTGIVVLRGDVLVNDAFADKTGSLDFVLLDSAGVARAKMILSMDGDVSLFADGATTNVPTAGTSYALGKRVHFEWRLDLDQGISTLYLDSADGKGPQFVGEVDSSDIDQISGVRVLTTGKNESAVDNLKLTWVKKDATLGQALSARTYQTHADFGRRTLQEHKDNLDQVAALGYNTVTILAVDFQAQSIDSSGVVTFGVSSSSLLTGGMTGIQATEELVTYALSLGLETIVEVPAASKMGKLLNPLLVAHPNLVMDPTVNPTAKNQTINPFYTGLPNSIDPYEAIIGGLVDEIVSWYGATPPSKILLASDENEVAVLENFAASNASTYVSLGYASTTAEIDAGIVYADLFNRMTDYLQANHSGITGLAWGDMLLSRRLGLSEAERANLNAFWASDPDIDIHPHEVLGWQHDTRFLIDAGKPFSTDPKAGQFQGVSYLGERVTPDWKGVDGADGSTIDAVNYLRNRNRIIIADWQYDTLGHIDQANGDMPAYPSVDYFQRMGFADVWGATWYDPTALRNFSQYVRDRLAGGMIATEWTLDWENSTLQQFQQPHLVNSAKYFSDPDFVPPTKAESQLTVQWAIGSATPIAVQAIHANQNESIKLELSLPAGLNSSDVGNPKVWFYDRYGNGAGQNAPFSKDLTWNASKSVFEVTIVPGDFSSSTLPQALDALVAYDYKDTDYLVTQYLPHAIVRTASGSSDDPVDLSQSASSNSLYSVDFSSLTNATADNLLYQPGGTYGEGSFIVNRNPTGSVAGNNGGLNTNWATTTFSYPTEGFYDEIRNNGMNVKIDFTLANDPGTTVTLFSSNRGMRILVLGSNKVLFGLTSEGNFVEHSVLSTLPLVSGSPAEVMATYDPNLGANGFGRMTLTVTQNGTSSSASLDLTRDLQLAETAFAFGNLIKGGVNGEIDSNVLITPALPGVLHKIDIQRLLGGNSPPLAVNDSGSVDVGSSVTIDVLANDTDLDAGQTLSISAVTQGTSGLVTNNGTDVTYTPSSGFFGSSDSFTYTVSDGNGGFDTATVDVAVQAAAAFIAEDWNDLVVTAGETGNSIGWFLGTGTGGTAPSVSGGKLTTTMAGASGGPTQVFTSDLSTYSSSGLFPERYVATTRVSVSQFPDITFASGNGVTEGIALVDIRRDQRLQAVLTPTSLWIQNDANWTEITVATAANTDYTWQFEVDDAAGTVAVARRESDANAFITLASNVPIRNQNVTDQVRANIIYYNGDNTQTQGILVGDYFQINEAPPALLAAGPEISGSAAAELSEQQLAGALLEATRRWQLAGADSSILRDLTISIGDLTGNRLGQMVGNRIVIDSTAAGYGWYVDQNMETDKEFHREFDRDRKPEGIDLLTVVMHELGHALGYGHDDPNDSIATLMDSTLATGERRLLFAS